MQEAGRAGRDGLHSECLVFYARRDCPRILNMLRMGGYATMESFCKKPPSSVDSQGVLRAGLGSWICVYKSGTSRAGVAGMRLWGGGMKSRSAHEATWHLQQIQQSKKEGNLRKKR
eukprot:1157433-Pelagomonas_calceolata.AAC.8